MKLSQLFHSYELLADKADEAFQSMEKEHGVCIKCERHCSDCCHAVFGLFLIETAYLKEQFDRLAPEICREALQRCNEAERAIKRLEIKLQNYEDDQQMQIQILAKERIRCPLLNENQECILYAHRPITCRVYGIPTKIHGKAHACGKAEFKKGESYPTYDMDRVYRDLYTLSEAMLTNSEKGNPEKASLLISVPKAISTPLDDLIYEIFG